MNVFFSTGKVRVGNVGATLTDEDNLIATIQSGEFNLTFQEKKLMEAAQISTFALLTSFYGGSAKFKFDSNDIVADLLVRIGGAVKTQQGGRDIYTIGKQSKPSFCKVEFEGEDVDGNTGIVTLNKAYALSLPISLKLDDHASISIEFEGLPDNTGAVCSTSFVTPV